MLVMGHVLHLPNPRVRLETVCGQTFLMFDQLSILSPIVVLLVVGHLERLVVVAAAHGVCVVMSFHSLNNVQI